jgi:putative hydrolase of the HAD superfamily
VFLDVCGDLGVEPGEALFVDDNIGHIRRAEEQGLQVIHFTSIEDYEERIRRMSNIDRDQGR